MVVANRFDCCVNPYFDRRRNRPSAHGWSDTRRPQIHRHIYATAGARRRFNLRAARVDSADNNGHSTAGNRHAGSNHRPQFE